ncbi:MAG TPA: MaoC/PaaZ C-terminal domain-containing protein [Polyangiaceae bacterium]|nr:MaoC/PaaZ C-terminal domain-containing protein [Polyangiaceae bacterium]
MSVSMKHAFAQGPAVAALGRVALSGLRNSQRPASPQQGPGPWVEARLPARPEQLVRDYIRHVGGDPAWYRGRLPPHLFPQWGFALAARALLGLGYPLARAINGGCRIENRAPLPAGEPLDVRARIESIDDDGHRAIITQRVVTGTAEAPEALVADLRAFIPLGDRNAEKANGKKPAKARPTVPAGAHEIAFLRIREDAGLDFAKLTGDFNPIHWLKPYARAAGFRTVILHGFSTVARAAEALNRARFAGDPYRLKTLDVRLSRPLVLPARVGVYVSAEGGVRTLERSESSDDTPKGVRTLERSESSDDTPKGARIWVGDAPGGGAYLEGRFEAEARS